LADKLVDGPLTVRQTIALEIQVADALRAAHRQGIVHRDLKPHNLFLSGGALDNVVVIDFGIAHLKSDDASITVSGQFVGTPAYAAPEQAEGAELSQICLPRGHVIEAKRARSLAEATVCDDPPRVATSDEAERLDRSRRGCGIRRSQSNRREPSIADSQEALGTGREDLDGGATIRRESACSRAAASGRIAARLQAEGQSFFKRRQWTEEARERREVELGAPGSLVVLSQSCSDPAIRMLGKFGASTCAFCPF
jgi:serine/threonine protein kinase